MAMIANMFAGATGINPEPLLNGVESLYYKILTLIHRQTKPLTISPENIEIRPYETKIERLQTKIKEMYP
jgi:hypothetical protein